jgi:beta-glucosidase
VLFGGYNPAGRIPMTWYKDQSQLPDLFDYDLAKNPRTYRYVREPVLFPFGHGLSYSRFTYHSLMPVASVIKAGVKQRFKVKITNDSARDAEEVVQFYVSCKRSDYKRAVKELAGFQRISFSPYESRTVEFLLDEEMLKVWDPVRRRWFLESSEWEAQMGSSSADIRCTAEFSVEGQKIEARDPSVRNYADSFFDADNYLLQQSGDEELFCSSLSDKDCRFFLGPTDFGKRSYSFLELELSGDSEGTIRFSDSQNGAIEYGDMIVKNTADASRIVKVPCEIPQRILEPVLVFTGTVRMYGFRFT